MLLEYLDKKTYEIIDVIEAEPECGIDFCDSCGDCLHCFGEDECFENTSGIHRWVKYIKRVVE